MTAASATAGCWNSQSSTSIDETFSPPVMITSFLRSLIAMYASSWYPPSPVWNQPSRIAFADDRGFRDRGMLEQAVLDLDRRDVLAAGDDHVLLAVAEAAVRVVLVSAVAGVEPALPDRLRRFLGLVPV